MAETTPPTSAMPDSLADLAIVKKIRALLKKLKRSGQKTSRKFMRLIGDFWVFAYIVIALVGTQIALFEKPIVGAYINAAAFVVLLLLALWRPAARQLAVSAAILPVVNMVSLTLPQTTVYNQTMVFYDALLLIALIYRFVFTLDQPLESTRMSLKGYAVALPIMVVIGEVLAVIGFGMLRHHYTFDHNSLPLVAASAVVFAFAEEAFFRGLIQQRAALVMKPVLAALLSVVLYTAVSFGHITYLAPLFALISGIVLSFTYYKKQNLVLTATINAAMKLGYIGLMAGFIFR